MISTPRMDAEPLETGTELGGTTNSSLASIPHVIRRNFIDLSYLSIYFVDFRS